MYFLLSLCLQAMCDNLRSREFYPLGNVSLLSTLKSVNICNYLSTPQVTAGLFGEKKRMKMAAKFLTRFGEKITKSRLVGLSPLHRSQRLSCFIYVLCTLLLCLLCKTYIGASVCLSVCMDSHMTTFAYLHTCLNTCSICGWWEAKGTFARLTRPEFDPPSTC